MKINRIITTFVKTALLIASISTVYADNSSMMVPGYQTAQTSEQAAEELGQRAAIRYANELFHHASDPTAGNPQGSIVLVEFFDFRCGHCIRMFPILQDLIHQYPNLKIIYKNYPVLGPESEYAAQAALASNLQQKYILFQSLLMGSEITYGNVLALAQQAGLNIPKLKADMKSEQIENEINTTNRLAERLGLVGTPSFFIAKANLTNHSPIADVVSVPGEASEEELQEAINSLKS